VSKQIRGCKPDGGFLFSLEGTEELFRLFKLRKGVNKWHLRVTGWLWRQGNP
jgi:hypothetical protein